MLHAICSTYIARFRTLFAMNRNPVAVFAVIAPVLFMLSNGPACAINSNAVFHIVSTANEPMVPGRFQPTWDSLKQYRCPDWFRNAKFGIRAHWGAAMRTGGRRLVCAADEGKGKPFMAEDFRFATGSNTLYAIEPGWPMNGATIKSLGKSTQLLDGTIRDIQLLGSQERIKWKQTADALIIAQPQKKPNDFAVVHKVGLE